jgi:hypothetical protein
MDNVDTRGDRSASVVPAYYGRPDDHYLITREKDPPIRRVFFVSISFTSSASRMAAIARDLHYILVHGIPTVITAIVRVAGHGTTAHFMSAFTFIRHN